MPFVLDTANRADMLAWVIAQLLAEHGSAGLSMRRIATASHLSTSSLVHHWGGKERLLRVACFRTTRQRLDDIDSRINSSSHGVGGWRERVAAFLPNLEGDHSLVLAKAWLGWRELWRTQPSLVKAGADARGEERWMLGRAVGGPPDGPQLSEQQLDAAYALLEGLVVAVCAPIGAIARDRAATLLTGQIELMLGDGAGHRC